MGGKPRLKPPPMPRLRTPHLVTLRPRLNFRVMMICRSDMYTYIEILDHSGRVTQRIDVSRLPDHEIDKKERIVRRNVDNRTTVRVNHYEIEQ